MQRRRKPTTVEVAEIDATARSLIKRVRRWWQSFSDAEQEQTSWMLGDVCLAILYMRYEVEIMRSKPKGKGHAPKAKRQAKAQTKDREAKAPRARSRQSPRPKAQETKRSRKANTL